MSFYLSFLTNCSFAIFFTNKLYIYDVTVRKSLSTNFFDREPPPPKKKRDTPFFDPQS
jgi:hypothetical protein